MASASIAFNRFGLGARPDDRVAGDPKTYLLDQFARYDPRPAAIAAAADSHAMAAALADYQDERRLIRQQMQARPASTPAPATPDPTMSGTPAAAAMSADKLAMRDAGQVAARAIRANYATAVGARTNVALGSDAPFVERLVQFWSNHFAVSIDKLPVVALAGPMEFEAIRPHVLGRFADMLNAVERHPAMLLYLDQAVSVGPAARSVCAPRRAASARSGSTKTSHAKSSNCTPWASAPATRRGTSPNSRAR